MADRKLRPNLQVSQPGIEGDAVNDGNGWPTPLTDPSNPLRMGVTNGSNGSQSNKDLISTSQQDSGAHHLAEGYPNGGATNKPQGSHGNEIETSQQNAGDYSGQ
jgi:hypothetical protein